MGLPGDAVADGFDCCVGGSDEDDVGEFCDIRCFVDDRNVWQSLFQPSAVFRTA